MRSCCWRAPKAVRVATGTEPADPARAPEPQDLPTAHGAPPAGGRLREAPEDFRVEEVLGFEADGSGGHVLLIVEKRGANTGWVASQLARTSGIHVRDVGWSGHKDRNALTRQAFSLPWPPSASVEPCLAFAGEGYAVVSASRHGRKLRPGSHRANRFGIRVREVAGDPAELEARLAAVAAVGVPNYFGPQRFGRGGSNLDLARRWARNGAAPRDRKARSFALSAARSAIFNAVLAERVRRGDWNRLVEGDAVMLDGRRSYFVADTVDDSLQRRCAGMDLHPSGPLWGSGEPPSRSLARSLEAGVSGSEAELCGLLAAQGLEHERRSLRLPVRGLEWRLDPDGLLLEFELPRGAFATAVLHEILRDAWDPDSTADD
jgi:tRNA pseudouridine13 synthase